MIVADGNPWGTLLFRRHFEGEAEGDWPIATVPPTALGAVGAKSRTVRLSRHTAVKQRRRHDDVRPEDYARVQEILDEGELFVGHTDRAIVGFLEADGCLWRAVLKVTKDRSETYLVSLHKAQQHNLDAARRRWRKIGRTGS